MDNRVRNSKRSMTVLTWAAVVGIAALAGCTPEVKDIRATGIEQYRDRQYVESMATMRHVLELSRNDAEANYYMGLNYRAMAQRKFNDTDVAAARRELDTAVYYFSQAVKSWPNYLAAVDAENEALEARGKYDEALKLAERVASNNRGGGVDHFIDAGNEYRERGLYDDAMRAYMKALSTNPQSSRAYAAMGKMYLQAGNHALAMDSLRKAYELNPKEPGVAASLEEMSIDTSVHTASGTGRPRAQ